MTKLRLILIGTFVVLMSHVLIGRTATAVECEVEDAIKRFGGVVVNYDPDKKEDPKKNEVVWKTVSFSNSTITDADFASVREAIEARESEEWRQKGWRLKN